MFAVPRLVDFGPLPAEIQRLFEEAVASFEVNVVVPVEMLETGSVFRAGNLSEDWLVTCAIEHVYRFGWDFCDANYERFSPLFQGVVDFARKTPLEEYLASAGDGSTTSASSTSCSATTRCSCARRTAWRSMPPGSTPKRGTGAIRRTRSTPTLRT